MKTKQTSSKTLCLAPWNGLASVVLFLSFFFATYTTAMGQCPPSLRFNPGVPGNPVGFEIDGNYFIDPSAATQDWSDVGVTGRSVLSENSGTGNAVPGVRRLGDSQLSSWTQDQNWGCAGCIDYSQFNGSSNKNGDDIGLTTNNWTYSSNGQAPQKNDITNTMVFFKRQGTETWLIGGAETRAVNGDSHLDFEYNQAGVYLTGSQTSGFIKGNGPLKGRTVGDFIVSVDYELGGTCPQFSIRVWSSQGRWNLVTLNPGDYFFAANVGAAPITAVSPGFGVTTAGLSSNTTERLQFVEFGVKSSVLTTLLNNICNPAATVTVKTRSSTSFTAELKDFVFFSFGGKPEVSCPDPQCVCQLPAGNTFNVSPSVCNPTWNYTWSIVSTTGPITANIASPGSCSTAINTTGHGVVNLRLIAEDNGCYDTCFTSVTVKPTPVCNINGSVSVQPNTTNTYSSQATADFYEWTISGAGTIVGAANQQSVQVAASPNCGTYTLNLTVKNNGCTAGTYCASSCNKTVTVEPCNQLCTYTQGAYGNAGGVHCNGQTTPAFVTTLLSTPLTVGAATKTITFTSADVSCLIAKLPSGGNAAPLNASYTCATIQPINNGKIYNILLGQTIVLGLNVRIPGNNLADLRLSGRFITTAPGSGSGCGAAGTATGAGSTFSLPASVVTYLGANNRVSDLLQLANNALGGVYVPSGSNPGYSDISGAVDAINNAFDGCRVLVSVSNTSLRNSLIEEKDQAVTVFPNPFKNELNIRVETSENKPLSIEIMTISGSHVATVYDGDATESGVQEFRFDSQQLPEGVYLCKVRTGKRSSVQRIVLYRND